MDPRPQFIGAPITPVLTDLADAAGLGRGEPALPGAFRWRGGSITVAGVTRRWRQCGPCRHGSGEAYLRRHWFEVVAGDGRTLTIYFERQPRGGAGGRTRGRWTLFTSAPAGGR